MLGVKLLYFTTIEMLYKPALQPLRTRYVLLIAPVSFSFWCKNNFVENFNIPLCGLAVNSKIN